MFNNIINGTKSRVILSVRCYAIAMGQINEFTQRELNKMGLMMNNNKRETAIVRAHNALAYCWLSVFLRLGLFFTLFFLSESSFSQTRRPIATKFCIMIEVAVILIHWYQISPTPHMKILSAGSWTKIWHLVPTKIEQILAVLRVWAQRF